MGNRVTTATVVTTRTSPHHGSHSRTIQMGRELRCFYKQLDEEHKGLFDGIFAVAAAPGDAGALDNLKAKVAAHFSYEESQYGKVDGYDVAGHKAKHDEFLKAAGAVNVPVSTDQVVFMKQWLVDHITNSDFTYKGKL